VRRRRIESALAVLLAAAVGGLAIWAFATRSGGHGGPTAGTGGTATTPAVPGRRAPRGGHGGNAALARKLRSARPGETIRLEARAYRQLRLSGLHLAGPVTVAGSPGTTLGGIVLHDVRNLRFADLTVAPQGAGQTAEVALHGSRGITFSHVRFDGLSEAQGVQLKIARDSSHVRVEGSDFSRCRHHRACIQPGGSHVQILDCHLHDLRDADGIRGGGSDVRVEGNTIEGAVPGSFHDNRNDLIQIMGGGPWLVSRNHLGERRAGAAQIFVDASSANTDNPIHDVTIESNLFTGDMAYAVMVATATRHQVPPPRAVTVVNNTILAGRTAAVRVGSVYHTVPKAQRPLVANNVLGHGMRRTCRLARVEDNVIRSGATCAGRNHVGDPRLDATGRPTRRSRLLLDAANPAWAPRTDLTGRPRAGRPDIGAYELVGG
jgi:hypothetical protein